MKHSTKKPTAVEAARMDAISEFGCIACYVDAEDLLRAYGYDDEPPHTPCEIHHFLRGGKRIGHLATVGLCPEHHRGESLTYTRTDRLLIVGPSWHRERRAFRDRYGSDDDLLKLQNELIGDGK